MFKLLESFEKREILLMQPLSLAFVGDAVHTLYVRRYILKEKASTPKNLHKLSSNFCCASAQAKALDLITEDLLVEEKELIRRTRNTKNHNAPKNSDEAEYKKATCFEALVGYLFLSGEIERLEMLLDKIFDNEGKE